MEVTTNEIVAMLPARFTLAEITEIMGRHYQASLRDGAASSERTLRLFVDRVIEDLKKESTNAAQEGLEPKDDQQ